MLPSTLYTTCSGASDATRWTFSLVTPVMGGVFGLALFPLAPNFGSGVPVGQGAKHGGAGGAAGGANALQSHGDYDARFL